MQANENILEYPSPADLPRKLWPSRIMIVAAVFCIVHLSAVVSICLAHFLNLDDRIPFGPLAAPCLLIAIVLTGGPPQFSAQCATEDRKNGRSIDGFLSSSSSRFRWTAWRY
jgi:hypothetical protein